MLLIMLEFASERKPTPVIKKIMQLQIIVYLATVVVSFWGGKHWVKMAHDQEDWVYIGKGNRIVLIRSLGIS